MTPPARRHDPRLLADARRLAKLLSLGLRTVRTMDAAGRLPRPVKLGSKTLWSVAEVKAWIAAGCPDRQAWEVLKTARR